MWIRISLSQPRAVFYSGPLGGKLPPQKPPPPPPPLRLNFLLMVHEKLSFELFVQTKLLSLTLPPPLQPCRLSNSQFTIYSHALFNSCNMSIYYPLHQCKGDQIKGSDALQHFPLFAIAHCKVETEFL